MQHSRNQLEIYFQKALAETTSCELNVVSNHPAFYLVFITLQVKMTGTHLSQQVYALLTYIQATQSQTLLEQSTTAKNKAKDKKKVPKGQNLPGKVNENVPRIPWFKSIRLLSVMPLCHLILHDYNRAFNDQSRELSEQFMTI